LINIEDLVIIKLKDKWTKRLHILHKM
jgi:hypothetical protein